MSKASYSSENTGEKKRKSSTSRRRRLGSPSPGNKILSVTKFLKGKHQHIKTR